MADSGQGLGRSPLSRPGLAVSALVVALTLVLGGTSGCASGTSTSTDTEVTTVNPSTATSSPDGSTEPASAAATSSGSRNESDSICGLEGVVLEGTVTEAPEAEWAYHGTAAYPTSPVYGPGAIDAEDNFSYCFQHSPEGAVFAASSYMAQPYDSRVGRPWLEYYVADGPYREHLMSSTATARPSDEVSIDDVQMEILGFKLLSYDGATAKVDILVEATYGTTTFYHSSIHNLVWQEGDWKLSTETDAPIDGKNISNPSGYVMWPGRQL